MPFRYLFYIITFISFQTLGQSTLGDNTENKTREFNSAEQLIAFGVQNSLDIENNGIRVDQAKKDRLSALLKTIDVTGNLLSTQITNNTNLGVNLFPAEIFGGEEGTFREVELGVQHNTQLNNFIDIKLFNPTGYTALKLADLNIELTEATNRITKKQFEESIAASYYNILNIQKQIANTAESIRNSEALLRIVENKYEEGLIKQQELNDAKINHFKLQETKSQLEYLIEQHYLSLKILIDIPADEGIIIEELKPSEYSFITPSVYLNKLGVQQSILQEQYAAQNLKAAKQSFLPNVSLQLSNSWNLYNTEFTPFSGNWINSNYIGLRLNIPLPNSQQISNKINAQYEYKVAVNTTIKERNKAELALKTLQSEYNQAKSQIETNKKVLQIQKDTYAKNLNLYEENLVGVDVTIQSMNAVLAAEYDLTSSMVNLSLIEEKININNNNN